MQKFSSLLLLLLICLLLDTAVSDDVLCGGHYAPTCAECPQGNGAAWCNGECTWENDECIFPVTVCSGGVTAEGCDNCPAGEDGCGDTDCAWHPFTSLCRDAFSDDVRTASVHLNYSPPDTISQPAWWFQRVIPTASADATYFSSNGHRFGYGGIQQVDDSVGRVIFSLWDQGGCDQDVGECDPDNLAQTIACGTGVACEGFGGEGTGRKSSYDREPFDDNEAYYFVTQAAYLGNRLMEYTGYFYEAGAWRLLSRIQVSTNANEEWWMDGLYSFVEQWVEGETTLKRAALYGPSFMANTDGTNFAQVDSARFSHGTLENHEHVNAWQVGEETQYAVGIETGGDVVQQVLDGESFDYVSYDPYPELASFSQSIDCLNAASNTEDIESCLTDTTSTDSGDDESEDEVPTEDESEDEVPTEEDTPCFSRFNDVEVRGQGMVAMDTVKVGDYVRTGHGDFSRVFSLAHLDHDFETDFLQIYVDGLQKPLEITGRHMLFSSGKAVRADEVGIGNVLGERKISDINSIKRNGVYAPITESGDIVVSGIHASSYYAFLDGVPFNQHALSHFFFAPHRVMCSFDFELCENEGRTNGYTNWAYWAIQIMEKANGFAAPVQCFLAVLALPFLSALYGCEQMLMAPFATLVAVIGFTCFTRRFGVFQECKI